MAKHKPIDMTDINHKKEKPVIIQYEILLRDKNTKKVYASDVPIPLALLMDSPSTAQNALIEQFKKIADAAIPIRH